MGIFLVAIGVLLVAARLLDVDLGQVLCPTVLILLGAWLIARPYWVQSELSLRLLGDIKRVTPWTVRPEEFWVGIGNTELDFTVAEIPEGETRLRLLGLIHDLEVRLPAEAFVRISGVALVATLKTLEQKEEYLLVPWERSWGDPAALKRVHVECTGLIVELSVR